MENILAITWHFEKRNLKWLLLPHQNKIRDYKETEINYFLKNLKNTKAQI